MNLDQLFKAPEDSTPAARVALVGTAGAGKTYLSLLMASALARGKPIVVIDSEHGSAAKYRHLTPFRVAAPADFAKLVANPGKLPPVEHDPRLYTAGIIAAGKAGAGVIIVDSLSHAWQATKAHVDAIMANTRAGNSFTAWKDVTPLWDALMGAIMSSPAHVIVTIRAKPAYVLEEREGQGGRVKQVPVKVGMAPEVRDGADHAFDIVLNIDDEHRVTVSKTRMSTLDGRVMLKPGDELGREVLAWLENPATPRALADERVIAPAFAHSSPLTPAAHAQLLAEVDRSGMWVDGGEQDAAAQPPPAKPSPSPLMARAEALAARLPGEAAALEVYARAKDAKAALAKEGKAFAAMMASLPEAARPGMLDALEKRTAQVETNGGDWLAPIIALTETHDRAWDTACGRLGIPPDIEFERLTGATAAGLALYLMGL